jgi:ABC-type transport system involved in multi-copper enzyme maturation permease subunit
MGAIVVNTLREAFRRKQAWVLLIITAVFLAGLSGLTIFDLEQRGSVAKLVPLVVIPFVAVVLSTFVAARQLPVEMRERTLYPLLAKPIHRWQWLLAKYVGVVLISWIILGVLFAVFQIIIWWRGIEFNAFLYQGLVLLLLQIAVYDAMVLFFSLVLHADATVCLGLLIYVGSHLFSAPLSEAVRSAESLLDRVLLGAFLWSLPQFDVFNLTRQIRFNLDPTPWTMLLPFFAYAGCLIAAYLAMGSWRLQTRDL